MMASRRPGKIRPHPKVGLVFEVTSFEKPDERGVAQDFEETGWEDFAEGDYTLAVKNGVQHVKIHENAKKNGDAGIARHYYAGPGELYRLTAVVRLKRKEGRFKCRVNIAPRKLWGPQTGQEGNRSLEKRTDRPEKVECTQETHPGTEQITVRVKFHTFPEPGESGEGEIYSVKLERLK